MSLFTTVVSVLERILGFSFAEIAWALTENIIALKEDMQSHCQMGRFDHLPFSQWALDGHLAFFFLLC